MDKALKAILLEEIQNKELGLVIERLIEEISSGHPFINRVQQLERRFRELEHRIAMGTLSPADIDRVQARIAGGLREIIHDHQPNPAPAAPPTETKKESFTLKLAPDQPDDKDEKATNSPVNLTGVGFHEAIDYQGSPSKKAETITLAKSYGASYHIAVQAIRKCGMEMVKGDRAGGTIHATAPGNSVSRFGENIYVWVTPISRVSTRLHVVVDSANPETVFDLGRHQHKLSALMHQLRNG